MGESQKKKGKFVLKSISDVLRNEGIYVGRKECKQETNPSKAFCQVKRTNWFGYNSQRGRLPTFDRELHLPPCLPKKFSFLARTRQHEQPHQSLSGIARFRKIVNMVKHQNIWSKGFQSNQRHLKSFMGPMQANGTREILTFDVNYFKPDTFSHETLGMKAKAILVRPTSLRSEEDIKYLYRHTLRLKCLRKYPIFVRMELSKCLLYDKFEKGRVVLRQGDTGYYFYFIISGSVLVEIENVNKDTGESVKVIAGELKAGSSFGDVALVRESQRVATIICHEDSEFLKVAKPDFDEVLKKNHKHELQHCMDLLHKHPLFKNWKTAHLDNTIGSSKMTEYMHGEMIFKDMSVPSEEIYCVVQGTCLVIQKAKVWERLPRDEHSKLMLLIHAENTRKEIAGGKEFCLSGISYCYFNSFLYRKVIKYWVIRTLREGDFFGLGEGRANMSTVAGDKTIILLVHKSIFREYGKGTDLGQLRSQLIKYYPTDEESLKNYLVWKRKKEYQKSVVLEAIGRRPESRDKDHYMLACKELNLN